MVPDPDLVRPLGQELRLCAGRVGQRLNLSGLGADAGIDHTTARRWISKRLVKTPKLYFVDTGLATALLGIRSTADLETHPSRGPLVENFVVSELVKVFVHHGEPAPLSFWRDHAGHEVDVLVEQGAHALPIEVKSGQTIAADALAGLRAFNTPAGRQEGVLVYGGAGSYRRGPHVIQAWDGIS